MVPYFSKTSYFQILSRSLTLILGSTRGFLNGDSSMKIGQLRPGGNVETYRQIHCHLVARRRNHALSMSALHFFLTASDQRILLLYSRVRWETKGEGKNYECRGHRGRRSNRQQEEQVWTFPRTLSTHRTPCLTW